MSKTKKIAVLAIIAMVLTLLPVQLFAATADTQAAATRIFGAGRVETALEVCNSGWTSAATVVLAPADQANLVDALAAAPLAGQENAPILLTFKDSLDPAVKAKISALGAKKVYVVGAISDSVKNEVAAISGVTVEVLKGESRWETTKAINAKLSSPAGTFVVGYAALADALSVSSYAAANKYAILLADPQGAIPAGQSALGSKTYMVGGTSLVADISGATRIAGADRFETNKIMLQTLSFEYNKVYVANGFNEHLVDSLVAAPLAAKNKAAIVLADNSGTGAAANVVNANLTAASQVIALGGTGVVSDSVRDTVKFNTPATFAIDSIEPLNLTSFKVTFNQELDETTAETISNYKVNGTGLVAKDEAVMQSDKKTVFVVMHDTSIGQNEKVTLEVVGGTVYNSSKASSAPGKIVETTFTDTSVPTIVSVSATGNKKLKVTFSEPVNMDGLGSQASSWKINGTTLSALGLDTTNSNGNDRTGDDTTYTTNRKSNACTLYFNTALPTGTNTLLVKDGASGTSNGFLCDFAGFSFLESTAEFTVESKTDAPVIQGVAIVNDKLEVTFDRAMYKDPTSTQSEGSVYYTSAYKINDITSSITGAEFKTGSGDKTVKLSLLTSAIKKGVNVLNIDKDTKDAWGNKLSTGSDDIRMTFDYVSDTTKPTVTSVSCITDTKVRIQFSKTMDSTFLLQKANYKITKSDGTIIYDAAAANGKTPALVGTGNTDTVELELSSGKFDGSGYTITIKNLRDASLDGNVMDNYTTTFDGIDSYGPNILAAIPTGGLPWAGDNTAVHKVIVYFNEAVDSSTIITDNVGYTSVEGTGYNLPSGSSVSMDGTGKMLTVTFPDAYKICTYTTWGGTTLSQDTSTPPKDPASDKYHVIRIRISNIKDKNGNLIQGVAQTMALYPSAQVPSTTVAVGPTFVEKSFNLYDDGDDIKAEFEMQQEITNISKDDFKIGSTNFAATTSIAPTSAYTVGKKVYLRISGTDNVNAVRAFGTNAYLFAPAGTVTLSSKNSAGIAASNAKLEDNTSTNENRVYNDQVAPKILNGQTSVTPNSGTVAYPSGGTLYNYVDIEFTEPIDMSIAGNYEDDFIFSTGGVGLSVQAVIAHPSNSKVVRFLFTNGSITSGHSVTVKADAAKASIRDIKDRGPEDYNFYVPKQADKDGYSPTAI